MGQVATLRRARISLTIEDTAENSSSAKQKLQLLLAYHLRQAQKRCVKMCTAEEVLQMSDELLPLTSEQS